MKVIASAPLNYPAKEHVSASLVWDQLTQAQQLEVFQSLASLCWQIAQNVVMTATVDADQNIHCKDEVVDESV